MPARTLAYRITGAVRGSEVRASGELRLDGATGEVAADLVLERPSPPLWEPLLALVATPDLGVLLAWASGALGLDEENESHLRLRSAARLFDEGDRQLGALDVLSTLDPARLSTTWVPVEARAARPAVNHSRPVQRLAESSRLRRARDAPNGGGSARGTRSHAGEQRPQAQAPRRPQVAHGRGLASIPRTAPANPLRQPPRAPVCLLPSPVAPRSERFCELLSVRESVPIGTDPNAVANSEIGSRGAARADASSQNRSARLPKPDVPRSHRRALRIASSGRPAGGTIRVRPRQFRVDRWRRGSYSGPKYLDLCP